MIYTDSQLKEKIVRMIESFENEVVEFKEARTNYSFNDIGKYFSALSNEANLRGLQEAWLIFGISDDKRYVGTEFRKQGSLQSLKKEIVNGTNERLTFLEIYELTMEKCRVIAFQIPPAIRGIPTTWQGAAYAREHESIFSNILDDLKNNLGNRKVSLLLKDITEFDKEICKIAGFIFLEKYEKYREDYFANELKYYPNIRYKIYNLYEQRENREKLWHLSEKYCQRIEWHLYRLYRLRNAIVHAGESHKRIQMLGEHLHIYVDRVILELMVKLAKDKCLGTIQDVFTDTYLLLNKKKKNLKEPGNVDEQSIMLLLENFFIEE